MSVAFPTIVPTIVRSGYRFVTARLIYRRSTRGTLRASPDGGAEEMRGPVKAATAGRRPDTMRFVRAVFCAVFGATVPLCVVLAGGAQESQPARLTFDVASIKRTGP